MRLIEPENSFWNLAIKSGYICGACNGVMPSDGSGSAPQHFPMLNSTLFPFRLCASCESLVRGDDRDIAREVSRLI